MSASVDVLICVFVSVRHLEHVFDEGTFPNREEMTQIQRQLWDAGCFI